MLKVSIRWLTTQNCIFEGVQKDSPFAIEMILTTLVGDTENVVNICESAVGNIF